MPSRVTVSERTSSVVPPSPVPGPRVAGRMAIVVGAAVLAVLPVGTAWGQAAGRSIFVTNDGNLEGSVTSFAVEPDGTLSFVDRVVTGMRDSLGAPCPGCNAYKTTLTPNGRYLAISHAASNDPTQRVTILEVASDASLTQIATFAVPSSPLDLKWLSNDRIAITKTSIAGSNEVRVYAFDPGVPSLILIDTEPTGSFSSSLALDPRRRYLYAQDSTQNTIRSFGIKPDGTLDHIQTLPTGGVYPLGMGVSPDGRGLYAGGGTSAGGHAIVGDRIDPASGALSSMPGSPFTSPGASPKQVVVAPNGRHALVAHGTDATLRSFTVDDLSGELVPTGFSFDVGLQGSLGEVAVMDNLVFFTDNTTAIDGKMGVYSFTLGINGSLTPNGTIVSTGGVAPRALVAWLPLSCPEDVDGDRDVGFGDLLAVLSAWGPCVGCPADVDGDGDVGFSDLLAVLSAWGPC